MDIADFLCSERDPVCVFLMELYEHAIQEHRLPVSAIGGRGNLLMIPFNRNPFGYAPWNQQRTYEAMFEILEADIVIMQEAKIQRKDLTDDMVLVKGWDVFFSLPRDKKGMSCAAAFALISLTLNALQDTLAWLSTHAIPNAVLFAPRRVSLVCSVLPGLAPGFETSQQINRSAGIRERTRSLVRWTK